MAGLFFNVTVVCSNVVGKTENGEDIVCGNRGETLADLGMVGIKAGSRTIAPLVIRNVVQPLGWESVESIVKVPGKGGGAEFRCPECRGVKTCKFADHDKRVRCVAELSSSDESDYCEEHRDEEYGK